MSSNLDKSSGRVAGPAVLPASPLSGGLCRRVRSQQECWLATRTDGPTASWQQTPGLQQMPSLDFSSYLRHKRPHECGRGTQECVRHALIRQPAFEAVAQTLMFAASALIADAQPMKNGG